MNPDTTATETQASAAETAEFHPVGPAAEFQPGTGRRVVIKGVAISVWRLSDGFYAIEDACPHMQASLAHGVLEDDVIACPRHGAQFEVRTGRLRSLPALRGLLRYPVRITDGLVCVGSIPLNDSKPDTLRL